MTELELLSI